MEAQAEVTAIDGYLQLLTVPQLKEALKTLNERRSGNKPELLLRIRSAMNQARNDQDVIQLRVIRGALEDALRTPRSGSSYNPYPLPATPATAGGPQQWPNTGHDPNLSRGLSPSPGRIRLVINNQGSVSGPAAAGHYPTPSSYGLARTSGSYPGAGVSSASGSGYGAAPSSSSSLSSFGASYTPQMLAGPKQAVEQVRFRPLPYYEEYSHVVRVKSTEAPAKGYYLRFEFTFDTIPSHKLTLSGRTDPATGITHPQYRVLYMMCSYEAATSLRINEPVGPGSPVDFPPYPQLFVNGNQVPARYAGLKNKPHTAFPADITKYVDRRKGMANKLEFRYQNTLKRYVGAILLVRKVPIATIVTRLREQALLSKEDVIASRRKQMAEDDDIVATVEIIALKDPISKLRITNPVRPRSCHHMQCFDAHTFLEMNENAPNFTCPSCHKPFEWDSVVVDGFFDDILKKSPAEVETVEVDPETWEWKVRTKDEEDEDYSDSDDEGGGGGGASHPTKVEVVDLDDEAPGPTSAGSQSQSQGAGHHASASGSSRPHSHPPRPAPKASNVIDLTLDSDDDDEPAVVAAPSRPAVAVPAVSVPSQTSSTTFAPGRASFAQVTAPHAQHPVTSIRNSVGANSPDLSRQSSGSGPRFGQTAPLGSWQNGGQTGSQQSQQQQQAAQQQQFSDNLPSDLENALLSFPLPDGNNSVDVVGGGAEDNEDLNALLQRIRDTFEGSNEEPLDYDWNNN